MSGSFENLRAYLNVLKSARACWCVVFVISVVHLVFNALGGPENPTVQQGFMQLGLSYHSFFQGKFWQIFTYGWLHGNGFHLALNAALVLSIGSKIEHITNGRTVLKTWFAGVIGGATMHLLLAPSEDETQFLVGLSGGAVALLLLLTTLSPESRMIPIPLSGRSLGLGIVLASMILTVIHPGTKIPGVSSIGNWLTEKGCGEIFQLGHACHLGGAIVGWAMGRWMLRSTVTLKRLRRERERREASELKRARLGR